MPLVVISTFGLTYGMPRFRPRSTKRLPKKKTTNGTNFRKCAIGANRNLVFNKVRLTSIGSVPRPNRYNIPAACAAVLSIMEADRAIYTRPHGSNPLRIPAAIMLPICGSPINFPRCVLINVSHGMRILIYFEKNDTTPISSIIMPVVTDMYC